MKKIREIIRLSEFNDFSQRQISGALNVSRPVVSETLEKVKILGLSYAEITPMKDSDLESLFTNKKKISPKAAALIERFPEYAIELKKPGVTLQLLWEEYIRDNPDGLKSTQFNFYFQCWKDEMKLSMHIDYDPGDKMLVDYAGKKMSFQIEGGVPVNAEIFVAILPASQMIYAEASLSQDQESFMRSNERAIRYYGGVPTAIVPDNLKSGVITPSIYEPELNRLYADFAEHYRTTIIPARSGKPKDKAPVENAVKIVYQRIFAPLRNHTFHSLDELNKHIRNQLEELNSSRKLTGMDITRRELFDKVEKNHLRSLPIERYPNKSIQDNTTVEFNYHFKLKEDNHYYSVPYLLRKKKVKVIYDDRNVAVYHDNDRIAIHRRVRTPHKYTTQKEHMPPNHRFKDDWNPEKLRWWAKNIGEETSIVINSILESKKHPETAYKSSLGILGLARKQGNDILNLACRRAMTVGRMNYPYIKDQVAIIQEQYEMQMEEKQLSLLPEIHENIRGKEYYQ